MKNYFFMAIAMLCLCLTGCNKFKSVETPLTGDFVSFTELSENGDTLTGVKNIKTGAVIVAPQMIDSIQVLEKAFAVYVNDEEASILAYRLDGKLIDQSEDAPFLVFEEKHPQGAKAPVYIGHREWNKVFYFPEKQESVKGQKFYFGLKHVFIEKDEKNWFFKTLASDASWKLFLKSADDEFYLIKDIAAKEETFFIGLLNPESGNIHLFTPTGEKVKVISSSRWNKAKKQARRSTQIGNANYIECKNVAKI
ncbi:MAG: hypothetical protein J6J35_01335 [Alphaproteobacteria bacterium]|nr:hypothetical protein [Alphaproteobacteria bacterium]